MMISDNHLRILVLKENINLFNKNPGRLTKITVSFMDASTAIQLYLTYNVRFYLNVED